MTSITVVLPIRTVSELNVREHWAKKAKRAREQRWAAAMALYNFRDALRSAGKLYITMTRISPNKMDDDNLAGALKHVRDGIADLVAVDDGKAKYSWIYLQEKGVRQAHSVKVRIEWEAS